jgi:hypothetical protein
MKLTSGIGYNPLSTTNEQNFLNETTTLGIEKVKYQAAGVNTFLKNLTCLKIVGQFLKDLDSFFTT